MNWDVLAADERAIWHPFTPFPARGPRRELVRAQGAYVWDSTGHRVLDATSSWWCQAHGHCHPEIVRAISEQAATMDQVMFAPHTHAPATRLAEALLEKLGKPFSKIFYSDNGSTAVEVALKLSLQYWQIKGRPEKKKFLALEGAYHGDTLGAVSVSHVDAFHSAFEAMTSQTLRVDPLKGIEVAKKTLAENADALAAVIVEPMIQGAAGMRFIDTKFIEELVLAAHRHSVLLIFDEVFTGFGRTGKMFAQEYFPIRPHFSCLSKGLTSGVLPLSVTAVAEEVFETFRSTKTTFFHGHTFTANPVSCAVALASLKLFETENTLAKVENISLCLKAWEPKFPNARTLGPIFAFELPNRDLWYIAEKMWEKGYWIRPLHQTLYVLPPYCTDVAELNSLLTELHALVS